MTAKLSSRIQRAEMRDGNGGQCGFEQMTVVFGDEPAPPETCDCGGVHVIRVIYADEMKDGDEPQSTEGA